MNKPITFRQRQTAASHTLKEWQRWRDTSHQPRFAGTTGETTP